MVQKLGIKKGDRVTIYLTMIPELAILPLACARIGVTIQLFLEVFLLNLYLVELMIVSEYIITADEGVRGGKTIPRKATTDEALTNCPNVKKCIVVKELEITSFGITIEMFGITPY